MSTPAWVLFACHVPLLVWLVWDRFRTVNRWADWFEEYILPPWARWSTQGDWISWFQHAAFGLGASLYVGSYSLIVPESFGFGAMLGGWIAVGCYAIREGLGIFQQWGKPNAWTHPKPHRVGWAVDGTLDVLLPLLNALIWTVL